MKFFSTELSPSLRNQEELNIVKYHILWYRFPMSTSSTFYEQVIQPQQDAEAHIAKIGGLPEITAAAEGLMSALAQTKTEIATATFASRFLGPSSDVTARILEQAAYSAPTVTAIEAEGEAGLKRVQLTSDYLTVENEVRLALAHLVSLRADLTLAQEGF